MKEVAEKWKKVKSYPQLFPKNYSWVRTSFFSNISGRRKASGVPLYGLQRCLGAVVDALVQLIVEEFDVSSVIQSVRRKGKAIYAVGIRSLKVFLKAV